MKLSVAIVAIWVAMVSSQTASVCTADLARTDECADVINANACYNQDRFKTAATLQCIDGTDNADKARKACMCCSCVAVAMCDWTKKQKLC